MRAAAAAALSAVLAVLPAAGAHAAPTGPKGLIESAVAEGGRLDVTFSAGLGGRNVDLRPGSLRATALPGGNFTGGTDLAPLARPSATSNGTSGATVGPRPSVVLALDTSGSMIHNQRRVDRMTPMRDAARQFLQQLDQRVDVAVVTFGDPGETLAPFGTPRPELIRRIGDLRPKGDTALFRAADHAAQLLQKRSGSRQILMLTDGQNEALTTHDRTTAAGVVRRLSAGASPIRFSALVIESTGGDPRSILNGLQNHYRGKDLGVVRNARDGTLGPLLQLTFRTTRQNIELQQAVSFAVPPRLVGTQANVRVSATTLDGRAVDDTQLVVFTGAAPPASAGSGVPAENGRVIGTPVVVLGLVALFGALATLLAVATGAVTAPGEPGSQVLRRLEVYSVGGGRPDPVAVQEQTITTRLGDNPLTRSAVTLMARIARRSRLDSALDERLEAAGLPLRTAEWMLLHVGAAVGGGVLFLLVSGGGAAPSLLGLLLGLAGPWIFLLVARARRRTQFLGQLPDTLQLLAGSLAAGYSLPQAMDAVVREAAAPIKDEFNRALIEARLGMLPEEALDGIARRTDSEDFSWIVMAIRIQRDVGGNLAQLLTTVAGTLRERERLRRQVSSLSAEGKLSGVILGALPVVFGGYLLLTRPEYIAPLFATPIGLALLSTGGLLLGAGGFWMAKLVRVDV